MPRGHFARTNKHKANISKSLTGHVVSVQTKEKMSRKLKGRKITWGDKISKSNTGENNGMYGKTHTEQVKQSSRELNLGKKASLETRKKMSESHKKEKSWSWKGGVSAINDIIRNSLEYKLWRQSVFLRDNFVCIWCGSKEKIEADHIKPFAYFPELRFAIDNGRTLCRKCHKTTDTYGNKSHK